MASSRMARRVITHQHRNSRKQLAAANDNAHQARKHRAMARSVARRINAGIAYRGGGGSGVGKRRR